MSGAMRAMLDEKTATRRIGRTVDSGGNSGSDRGPQAGDEFMVLADERRAREIATYRAGKFRNTKLAKQQAAKLENMFADMTAGRRQTLPIIVKADVQGSQEGCPVAAQAVHRRSPSAGWFTPAWVASANPTSTWRSPPRRSSSVSTPGPTRVRVKLAEGNGVDIRYYNIIYDAVDELKAAMSGMLTPEKKEEVIGTAEIRTVFVASKIGTVAGCMVTSAWSTEARIRLLRDNVVIYTGEPRFIEAHERRCARGQGRLRVRYQAQELQRHRVGDHPGVLRGQGNRPYAVDRHHAKEVIRPNARFSRGRPIQRDLTELIARAQGPAGGMVTIQSVEVTPDYAHAKVFFSLLAG